MTSNQSIVGRIYNHITGHDSSTGTRLLLIVALALVAHLLVRLIRMSSERIAARLHGAKNRLGFMADRPKIVTLHRLAVSTLIFAIYFLAAGLILQECGVNLTAYLASASVVGLAISFGSQGLVQDIVSGLTLIFLDTMDVGDMVEIVGTAVVVGRVEEIGLRFTKLVNLYNQRVLIPNRTIANVSRFPAGGVDAYADAWIPAGVEQGKMLELVGEVARGLWGEFGEILLSEPRIGVMEPGPATGSWGYVRVHFKIWPGQGSLIENTFRQQVVKAIKELAPNYADWQVPVTYRAGEAPQAQIPPGEQTAKIVAP